MVTGKRHNCWQQTDSRRWGYAKGRKTNRDTQWECPEKHWLEGRKASESPTTELWKQMMYQLNIWIHQFQNAHAHRLWFHFMTALREGWTTRLIILLLALLLARCIPRGPAKAAINNNRESVYKCVSVCKARSLEWPTCVIQLQRLQRNC